MDYDGVIPESLLKAIMTKDSRSQSQNEQHPRRHPNTTQQGHQQALDRVARWKVSSSSSSDSETPKMSMQQHQQIHLQQLQQQQRQQHFTGSFRDHQGTSSSKQQQPYQVNHQQQSLGGHPRQGGFPVGQTQAPAPPPSRVAPPLRRQMSVDIPEIPPRQMYPQHTASSTQFARSADSLFQPQTPSEAPAASFMPSSHPHPRHPVKQTSADSFFSSQDSSDSVFEVSPAVHSRRILSDTSFEAPPPGVDKNVNIMDSNLMARGHFQPTSQHNSPPLPSAPARRTTTASQPIELFGGGNSLYQAIGTNGDSNLPAMPTVNLTSPVVMDASEDNEMTSQPLFQSTQQHSLQTLRHPSPRPLTPIRRFPSPTPTKPASPFDPHAQLRRLTNVHCYSSTRTSNTPSPSPYNGIPIGIEMTPSPSNSYRTCSTPLSSSTPSPAPLMSLNTFLDMSASSLSSAVNELTSDATGSEATPPNFLFSQPGFQPAQCAANTGFNASISDSIPQFYSFLADLQDVEMTLNSRQGVTSGQSTPSTLTQESGDRVPTPEGVGEPLNLPTIIDDFLKNAHGNHGHSH